MKNNNEVRCCPLLKSDIMAVWILNADINKKYQPDNEKQKNNRNYQILSICIE